MKDIVPVERIESRILLIRGHKVMLDRDLAEIYGVETRVLKQAVSRNIERFPQDFMFELNDEEFQKWRSQFVMSKSDKMGLRWKPYAFTEQGIAMLSSVLRSERAVQMNILIMRAFVKLRNVLATHKELAEKFEELENRVGRHDAVIDEILDAIRELMTPVRTEAIGFTA